MQVDTARMLVQAIANSLEIAIDSRNRLTAFENLLKKHRPDLFQEYQDELNDVRRSLAIEFLENTRLPIDQVAERIGFSDAASFRRSFRKWTGHSPSLYRKGQGKDA